MREKDGSKTLENPSRALTKSQSRSLRRDWRMSGSRRVNRQPLDKQLSWITSHLNEFGVDYWLDSGTLLGLKRNGHLLESDRDIDIGVWQETQHRLDEMLKRLANEGIRVRSRSYRGWNFAYWIPPRDKNVERLLDIKVYKKHAGYAWCPSWHISTNRADYPDVRSYVNALAVLSLDMPLGWIRHGAPIDSWPWSSVHAATWWIPLSLIETRVFVDALDAFIPSDWENYLAFRYGNWQKPTTNWNFIQDDGSYRRQPPEGLLRGGLHNEIRS